MWTVSQLAQRCGLSRSTLWYYESIGLLKPASRTPANYRRYGERDLARLEQICVYRNAGLKLADIRRVLDRPGNDAVVVLKRRLVELDAEIEGLRKHQRSILQLLKKTTSLGRNMAMTKEKWTAIMRSAGFSDEDMWRWHGEFERSAGEEHQKFLEYLHITEGEIQALRERSQRVTGA
jgi:MerR family transcriptional regulator, thiopeptide resistance regulator